MHVRIAFKPLGTHILGKVPRHMQGCRKHFGARKHKLGYPKVNLKVNART